MQGRVVDRCLGLWDPSSVWDSDSPMGNAFLDGRVSRIYGGSSEIMKVIIGQDLGL
jgi:acyl-CoA dehydrogenase